MPNTMNQKQINALFWTFITSAITFVACAILSIYVHSNNKHIELCNATIINKIYHDASNNSGRYPTYSYNTIVKCDGYQPVTTSITLNELVENDTKLKFNYKWYTNQSVLDLTEQLCIITLIITIILLITLLIKLPDQWKTDQP